MWQATVDSKVFENGQQKVTVIYSDGGTKFAETYLIRKKEQLSGIVRGKLAELEASDADTVEIGPLVPDLVQPVTPDPLQVKLGEVRRLKELVDLGVLQSNSSEYVAAVDATKVEFDKK